MVFKQPHMFNLDLVVSNICVLLKKWLCPFIFFSQKIFIYNLISRLQINVKYYVNIFIKNNYTFTFIISKLKFSKIVFSKCLLPLTRWRARSLETHGIILLNVYCIHRIKNVSCIWCI